MKCKKCGNTFFEFESAVPRLSRSSICKLCDQGFAQEIQIPGAQSGKTPEAKMTKNRDDLLREFFS